MRLYRSVITLAVLGVLTLCTTSTALTQSSSSTKSIRNVPPTPVSSSSSTKSIRNIPPTPVSSSSSTKSIRNVPPTLVSSSSSTKSIRNVPLTPVSSSSSTKSIRNVPPTTPVSSSPSKVSTSTSSSRSAVPTITVANGATITVAPGTVVIGGKGGGIIIVDGISFSVPDGTTITADPTSTQNRTSISSSLSSTTTTSTSSTSSPTSSSTGKPSQYLIVPKDKTTQVELDRFTKTLQNAAGINSIYTVNSKRNGVELWLASLLPNQESIIAKDPVVYAITIDGPVVADYTDPPITAFSASGISQTTSSFDLNFFSQPIGTTISTMPHYSFDSQGGEGITVYIVDTGVNINNPEWQAAPGSKRWIYVKESDSIQNDLGNHGSCTASKVAGPLSGVAKKANMVMVKVPINTFLSDHCIALAKVINDVYNNQLGGKAVINLSLIIQLTKTSDIQIYTYFINILLQLDVVIVCSSGDKAATGVSQLNTYPSLLYTGLPIIVVGAIDFEGNRAPYSQGDELEVTTSASGNVICATGSDSGTTLRSGTSFAAPAIAGLAAYFLSLDKYKTRLQVQGKVAENVKELIRSLQYKRSGSGPAVAYNGYIISGQGSSSSSLKPAPTPSPKSSSTSSQISSSTTTTRSQMPPIPTFTNLPTFTIVFDERTTTNSSQKNCGSWGYYTTFISYVDSNYKDDPESWCTGLCASDTKCNSAFVFYQYTVPLPYYICNLYTTAFVIDYLQCAPGDSRFGGSAAWNLKR